MVDCVRKSIALDIIHILFFPDKLKILQIWLDVIDDDDVMLLTTTFPALKDFNFLELKKNAVTEYKQEVNMRYKYSRTPSPAKSLHSKN